MEPKMGEMEPRLRRMTTFAVVERIKAIRPHKDPRINALEVLTLTNDVQLVTGKHYRVGDLGIYLRPGCLIPGLLAEQLWLVGKKRAISWFEVKAMPMGIHDAPDDLKEMSLGLWAGEWYKHDKSAESMVKAQEIIAADVLDGQDAEGFLRWHFWRPDWTEGYCLDGHFGIVEAVEQPKGTKHDKRFRKPRPRSSKAERPVLNRQTQHGGSMPVGSIPVAGSLAD